MRCYMYIYIYVYSEYYPTVTELEYSKIWTYTNDLEHRFLLYGYRASRVMLEGYSEESSEFPCLTRVAKGRP